MSQAPKAPRKRARKSDGQYKGGTPAEAWEATELIEGVGDKTIGKTVGPKVDSPSQGKETAGKYKKAEKLTPTFGKVSTTLH